MEQTGTASLIGTAGIASLIRTAARNSEIHTHTTSLMTREQRSGSDSGYAELINSRQKTLGSLDLAAQACRGSLLCGKALWWRDLVGLAVSVHRRVQPH